jgi:hypothetical protein
VSAQHTPGPWVAVCEEGSYGVFVEDDGREIARLFDNKGNFPQSSFVGTQYLYDGQHEANARLIAEAPAMKEALRAFLTMEGMSDRLAAEGQARAILARIDGEAGQ